MAGRTIRVCPPRDFDFGDLGANDTSTVTVEERIDASQYDEVDLIVRVHQDATLASGAGHVKVQIVSDGYTTDDPSQDFFSEVLGSIKLQGAITAGELELATVSSPLGAMVAVQVEGKQPATAVTTQNARLSIDLAFKTSS